MHLLQYLFILLLLEISLSIFSFNAFMNSSSLKKLSIKVWALFSFLENIFSSMFDDLQQLHIILDFFSSSVVSFSFSFSFSFSLSLLFPISFSSSFMGFEFISIFKILFFSFLLSDIIRFIYYF